MSEEPEAKRTRHEVIQTTNVTITNKNISTNQVRSPWTLSFFTHVQFTDAVTQQQVFQSCVLSQCTFHSIQDSTFEHTRLDRTEIQNDIINCRFIQTRWEGVNMTGGVRELTHNVFTDSTFIDVNWGSRQIDVTTSSFTNCTFTQGDMRALVFSPYHPLYDCVFDNVLLRPDQLRTCVLRRAVLDHAILHQDEETRFNFQDCDLYECTFRNINLFDTNSFIDANATKARFTECVLSFPTIFQQCTVRNVTFDRCDLRNVDFHGCDLTGCDFTGSNQLGMRVEGAFATANSIRGMWTVAQRFPELVAQQQRQRAMANQVHEFSRRIRWRPLNQWLEQHTVTPVAGPSYTEPQAIPRWVQQHVSDMIDRTGEPEWKVLLTDIMDRRLLGADWNEFSPEMVQTAIHAVQYTLEQSNAFQRGYAEGFVKDTTNAYDGNDVQARMSCVYGALERLTISLLNGVTSARTDAAVTNDDPYDPLVRMIQPPTTEQLIKEWYLLHENSGDHAFRTDGSKEEREASLREYVAQHGGSAEELNGMILGLTFDDDDFNRHLEQIIRNWYRFHNNQRQHAFPAETTEDEKRDSLRAYVQQEYPAGRQQLETVLQTGAWRFGSTLFDAVVQGGRGRSRGRGRGRGRSRGRGGRGRGTKRMGGRRRSRTRGGRGRRRARKTR